MQLLLLLHAQVVGMGLLLTFIGMQTSKIVVPDAETMVSPAEVYAADALARLHSHTTVCRESISWHSIS